MEQRIAQLEKENNELKSSKDLLGETLCHPMVGSDSGGGLLEPIMSWSLDSKVLAVHCKPARLCKDTWNVFVMVQL